MCFLIGKVIRWIAYGAIQLDKIVLACDVVVITFLEITMRKSIDYRILLFIGQFFCPRVSGFVLQRHFKERIDKDVYAKIFSLTCA